MSKNTTAGRADGFEQHLEHATVDEALEQVTAALKRDARRGHPDACVGRRRRSP